MDVLVVAFLFYQFILLLRGTRAMQILVGVMLILAPLVLSKWIPLNSIVWILEKLLPIGLTALVIIFQPELRRALEHLGRGSPLLGRQAGIYREEEVKVLTDEVVKAACFLSKRKIGALVVIARRTGLEEHYGDQTKRGTKLNALIRAELLQNIFMPHAPLHDGAVIIERGRIEAAGVILPITDNQQNLDRSLGTRHHAAISITELSDAVAVVVSEETGTMSIAQNGLINRGLDKEGLERNLKRQLRPLLTGSNGWNRWWKAS